MSQQKQRQRVGPPRYKTAKSKPDKHGASQAIEHKVAWVAASPSLGYASVAGNGDPRELDVLRRTCAEHEHEGYRLVSVSALTGVIDPGLGGTGTVGWYLFFLRESDRRTVDPGALRRDLSVEPPDYLRREHVQRD